MKLKPVIHEIVKNYHDKLIQFRRHLHEYPELSHEEIKTSQYVRHFLESEGIHGIKKTAETGLVFELPAGKTSKIAFRCDLDALQITEETGLSYSSKHPGIMHACGHDVHTTIAVGIALTLHQLQNELKGGVKFIFQPAEEATEGGAELVIQEGIMDDVQAAFGIHVDPSLSVGQFGVKNGAMMASIDFFEVTVNGRGGHGARPHQTVDTLFVASQMMNAIYQLNGRYLSPLEEPSVVSICQIQGGQQANVIPEICTFSGTFRTFDDNVRSKYRDLIRSVVQHVGAMYGAECTVNLIPNAPPVINDEHLGQLIEKTVQALHGKEKLIFLEYPMMASEDFAYYRQKCPIYFLRIGTSSGEKTSYPLHSPKFCVDEKVMDETVELMSHALIRYWE